MSEYWKSADRYWCKHCACYVRDTPLERRNHEATGKHQGALKRFLRELHRGHEREEREKERARYEIERLNGVVGGSSSAARTGSSTLSSSTSSTTQARAPSENDLKKQREQLAQMGVQMPDTFKPEMAMPGEWTVTNTRVVETNEDGEEKVEAKATGVRKREMPEEMREEEAAVRSLFKKPRRWGRDDKTEVGGEDDDLDALLSGSITTKKEQDTPGPEVKKEQDGGEVEEVKREDEPAAENDAVKKEPDDATQGLDEVAATKDEPVKQEDTPTTGAVVFKKRKAKNIRQK